MGNKVQSELEKIEIPAELNQRSKQGVLKAKAEMMGNQSFRLKGVAALAASLLIVGGSYGVYNLYFQNEGQETMPDRKPPLINEGEGIFIPAIELPETSSDVQMSMIGLIVYNGKIYTQTATSIEPGQAKALLGEKLGRTKGNIDEWSTQDEYAVEFASTIGEMDVYTVKGYDPDFRIMAYNERNGEVFTEFYEALNGITVNNGGDIFEKLNLTGNVVSAQYQNYSDWNYDVKQFYPISDGKVLQDFVAALNNTIPYSYQTVESTLGDYMNDEEYKRLTLYLKDGTKVDLAILKDGYIRYSYLDVFFKMEEDIFSKMWEQMVKK